MGKYTPEQKQFIIDNIKGTKYRVLADMLNNKFGTNKTGHQLKHYCRRHGLKNDVTSESGQFKKGHSITNNTEKPIGSERINQEGQLMIKVSNDAEAYNGYKNWKMKKVVIWESYHGTKPNDYTVLNLDGDKMNCDISNLILIEKSENRRLYKLGYVFNDPQLTLSALYYIRLGRQRRKRERELKK